MAELSNDGSQPGNDGTQPTAIPVAGEGVVVDPASAVRVSLAPASATGGEPPLLVGLAAGPLRMTNPSVGIGPLGGSAVAPRAAPGDGGVRTQRQVLADRRPVDAAIADAGHGRAVLEVGGERVPVVLEPEYQVAGGARRREVLVGGFRFEVDVQSERLAALRERATRGREGGVHGGPLEVHAIIPGKVVSVSIAVGDEVTAGQQLLVVEAMKMQNELRAPRDGTIQRVGVAPGVNIEVGDLLVVIS
jgi:biotin carboxyl carrier protein